MCTSSSKALVIDCDFLLPQVSNKINILHGKISDVLHVIERKITTLKDKPLEASIYRHIIKLKGLLKMERHEYDVSCNDTRSLSSLDLKF